VSVPSSQQGALADPPEVTIGERLFEDTRFSQFFAAHYDGNVNHPLAQGDPLLESVDLPGKQFHGPFATRSINCRSCHFVAEFGRAGLGYQRAYSDFAQRSRVPQRDDGTLTTPRNSMSMVDSFIASDGAFLLHADGEFASTASLVKSTMTGRNYGWLPAEYRKAVAHIAKVIREDDGTDAISRVYGGAYARILAGTDPQILPNLRLPQEYRFDVATASDQQILDGIAKLMTAYLESLSLSRDRDNVHDGSPYDRFLELNKLPASPEKGESDAQYTARLARAVADLKDPKFVDEDQQLTWFYYHQQKFNFGPEELEGLKIFLGLPKESAESPTPKAKQVSWLFLPFAGLVVVVAGRSSKQRAAVSALVLLVAIPLLTGWKSERSAQVSASVSRGANCTACHTAPDFTDRHFHNNGASQDEYDSVHGSGSFAKLKIPDYGERESRFDQYMPATPQHPRATGVFRLPPTKSNPNAADLGLWNVFGNPDLPEPQAAIRRILCGNDSCDPKTNLPRTIALFRTPTLRDLGDTSPYMHTGRLATIEDVLQYYINISELAKQGQLRNGAPELKAINLSQEDIKPLAAFLRSLNEDYD
jgi:cytochrome c553